MHRDPTVENSRNKGKSLDPRASKATMWWSHLETLIDGFEGSSHTILTVERPKEFDMGMGDGSQEDIDAIERQ